MKKLILVALLLVAVLLVSWWTKGAHFSILTMMQTASIHPTATTSTLGAQTQPTTTPVPVEILITVTPNGFVPDALMIAPNTKITWVNKTTDSANISSYPQDAYQQLNLGDFEVNNSVSLVFDKPGRYNYYNSKIPTQRGAIIVK